MIRIDMSIFVFPMSIFKSYVTHKFFRLINVGTVMIYHQIIHPPNLFLDETFLPL